MRRYIISSIIIVCVLVVSGCASAISKNLIIERSDWSVHVDKITDGPNSYRKTMYVYSARPGYKLIWAHMRIQNRSTMPRQFDLRGIILVTDKARVRPGNIPRHKHERSTPDIASEGQYKTELNFMIPESAVPTKLVIPGMGELKIGQQEKGQQ